jgi:hypothetical protein
MEKNVVYFSPFNSFEIKSKSPFKTEGKLNFEKLTLIAGENGTGKSFTMKLQWVANFYFSYMITNKNYKLILDRLGIKNENIKTEQIDEKEFLKFCFETTFDDFNEFDIELKFIKREKYLEYFEYGMTFKLKNGEIEDFHLIIPDNLLPGGPVCYLSNSIRNFNRFEQYLMTKKMLGIQEVNSYEDFKKLTDFFKLYELITIEYVLNNLKNATTLEKSEQGQKLLFYMSEIFEKYQDYNIIVDEDKCKIYFQKNNIKKPLSSLSAGEQSLLTMMFAI